MGNVAFASKLKKARITAGFTQKDIYERLGISQSTFSSWETGKAEPDADTLIKLCQYYNIESLSYFSDIPTIPSLTPSEHRIGKAYGKADPPVQRTVEVALEPFMDNGSPIKKAPSKSEDAEIAVELYVDIEFGREASLYYLPASAGTGVFLDGNDYEVVRIGPEVPPSASFGVRISGDSMEPKYPDGHVAWVKLTPAVDVGQVGVFMLGGEGYIKKLGHGELISLNPKYDPIPLPEDGGDLRVYGQVVAVTEDVY